MVKKKDTTEALTEETTTESKYLQAMTFFDDDTNISPAVKKPMYTEILKAFRNSNNKVVKIDVGLLPHDKDDKPMKVTTVYYGLGNVLKTMADRDKFKLVVRTNENAVYIKKV